MNPGSTLEVIPMLAESSSTSGRDWSCRDVGPQVKLLPVHTA